MLPCKLAYTVDYHASGHTRAHDIEIILDNSRRPSSQAWLVIKPRAETPDNNLGLLLCVTAGSDQSHTHTHTLSLTIVTLHVLDNFTVC